MTGAAVDCGLAGTVMRFLPPAAPWPRAPSPSTATSRPAPGRWATILDALRGLGADIDGDALPFTVRTVTVACAAGR